MFACKCPGVIISSCLIFNSVHCSKLGASYLFTAHHSNDQVETFLLRLAHYSNSDGLAGMYRIKKFMDITVVRPLLSLSKVRRIFDFCPPMNSRRFRNERSPRAWQVISRGWRILRMTLKSITVHGKHKTHESLSENFASLTFPH